MGRLSRPPYEPLQGSPSSLAALKTQPLKAGLYFPELQTRCLSVYLAQAEVLTGW